MEGPLLLPFVSAVAADRRAEAEARGGSRPRWWRRRPERSAPPQQAPETTMDHGPALTHLEVALEQQLVLAGGDPSVETAARSLLTVLEPAVREITNELAQQAAAEVAAQLPSHEVEVVLREGEPVLRVSAAEGAPPPPTSEDFDARLTLRLPPSLKAVIEEAAASSGDSVNAWVVKTLNRTGTPGRSAVAGQRVTGTIRT